MSTTLGVKIEVKDVLGVVGVAGEEETQQFSHPHTATHLGQSHRAAFGVSSRTCACPLSFHTGTTGFALGAPRHSVNRENKTIKQ